MLVDARATDEKVTPANDSINLRLTRKLREAQNVISLLALAFLPASAQAQSLAAWERLDFAKQRVDSVQVDELPLAAQYFDERYWYRRRENYSPSDLSAVERANADTIALARMRDLGYAVAPGMMYLFQSQPLTDSLLNGISLNRPA